MTPTISEKLAHSWSSESSENGEFKTRKRRAPKNYCASRTIRDMPQRRIITSIRYYIAGVPRGPSKGRRKRRPWYTSAGRRREHRARLEPRLFAAAYIFALHVIRYLIYTKPLLFALDTESGEFRVQRGLVVHIGFRLRPR